MDSRNSPKNRAKNNLNDSFLEALRGLGENVASSSKNAAKDIGSDFYQEIFNLNKPQTGNQETNFANQERNLNRQPKLYKEPFSRSETLIFSREQIEIKKQVVILQQEIQGLAKATGDLANQAQIASMENIPQPGNYHKNFFEVLINFVKKLRSQIQESSFWLQSWNKKAQKRNFYWGRAKKSGASFMLHYDRSVATQTG